MVSVLRRRTCFYFSKFRNNDLKHANDDRWFSVYWLRNGADSSKQVNHWKSSNCLTRFMLLTRGSFKPAGVVKDLTLSVYWKWSGLKSYTVAIEKRGHLHFILFTDQAITVKAFSFIVLACLKLHRHSILFLIFLVRYGSKRERSGCR